ncbi:mandelate racemase/muconate lactonizing enzyme family protein [Gryllotalpicola reticulitermitis]|uniref:Mandelate racemase/muconate lactonizing enzyme family protein n=1 Tax=Gryllotalpicola reticulitermitis TaxID=1184153 RepID=A0ABV8Q221_9MICO
MRIEALEPISVDFGWRTISYLKVSTDAGIVGWSEFSESFGNPGLAGVITAMSPYVVGRDPRRVELVTHDLAMLVRPARGGVNRQAIAAIENALLDIKARDLDVSVSDMLGGKVRDSIPVYWSHAGFYRLPKFAPYVGVPPLTSYDDARAFAASVRAAGFTGMKTNVLGFGDTGVIGRTNPYARAVATTGRGWDTRMIDQLVATVAAFREGAGDDADIYVDVNFMFDLEGYRRVAAALAPFGLAWLEFDHQDAVGMARVRHEAAMPIGSGEAIYERVGYRPFFEAGAWDAAIVDVLWNGYLESLKIASMAEAYSIPVAPHNFYGHLATAISAHFCAAVPNLHVMELDVDSVAWRDELVVEPPRVENGMLQVPSGPGWGIEIDEAALRRHAPTKESETPWK